jgi:anti-sigma factor RsiW
MIPGANRLLAEVTRAVDYARQVQRHSPESSTPADLRNFLRQAALLLSPSKAPAKKD